MADRREREHALDVGLHDSHHRADHHGQHGEHPHHRSIVVAPVRQGVDQDPQHRAERGDLADRGHVRRHRCRRALVDVGRPEVEGHGGDLEPEPDHQQPDAGEDERVVAHGRHVVVERVDDGGEVGAAGSAVHHRDAVEEERRREATEDEVLDATLLALDSPAMTGRHHVQSDRQDLQTEEQARRDRWPTP